MSLPIARSAYHGSLQFQVLESGSHGRGSSVGGGRRGQRQRKRRRRFSSLRKGFWHLVDDSVVVKWVRSLEGHSHDQSANKITTTNNADEVSTSLDDDDKDDEHEYDEDDEDDEDEEAAALAAAVDVITSRVGKEHPNDLFTELHRRRELHSPLSRCKYVLRKKLATRTSIMAVSASIVLLFGQCDRCALLVFMA